MATFHRSQFDSKRLFLQRGFGFTRQAPAPPLMARPCTDLVIAPRVQAKVLRHQEFGFGGLFLGGCRLNSYTHTLWSKTMAGQQHWVRGRANSISSGLWKGKALAPNVQFKSDSRFPFQCCFHIDSIHDRSIYGSAQKCRFFEKHCICIYIYVRTICIRIFTYLSCIHCIMHNDKQDPGIQKLSFTPWSMVLKPAETTQRRTNHL